MFSVVAQAQQVQRIEIWDAGTYKSKDVMERVDAPGTPQGYRNIVSDIELQQRTTTVPAILGTSFGFRFSILGKPAGATINLKFVSRYPSPGLQNPKTGNSLMRGEYSVQAKLDTKSWKTYRFDDDWELVPGTWTFEIWQDDRKLAEQSFTVVKP
jgi:hypothetical protein